MKIYEHKKWSFRNNTKRHKAKSNGKHPALVVGEENDKYINFGLTHSEFRGHHKNIELSKNPNKFDRRKAYLRDDVKLDNKSDLREILPHLSNLSKRDAQKVIEILRKKKNIH